MSESIQDSNPAPAPSKAEGVIDNVSSVAGAVLPAAEIAATVFGHHEITLILKMLDKYGPDLARTIAKWLAVKQVTLADVDAAFEGLKAYEAYGIIRPAK